MHWLLDILLVLTIKIQSVVRPMHKNMKYLDKDKDLQEGKVSDTNTNISCHSRV